VLLARSCAACGAPGPSPCPRCRASLRPPPALPPPTGVDACWSLLAYDGAARELVARLKYRSHRQALHGLATAAATLVAEPVDVVTWVPTAPVRRRARGFDQSALLAAAVARSLGRPCRRLLRRVDEGAQTGASRSQRRRGPALVAVRRCPARVLVVDDVLTTGASLARAAGAVRHAGASRVVALTIARGVLKPTTVRDEGGSWSAT
jgi:predicted amidophosphoribosyltransferase